MARSRSASPDRHNRVIGKREVAPELTGPRDAVNRVDLFHPLPILAIHKSGEMRAHLSRGRRHARGLALNLKRSERQAVPAARHLSQIHERLGRISAVGIVERVRVGSVAQSPARQRLLGLPHGGIVRIHGQEGDVQIRAFAIRAIGQDGAARARGLHGPSGRQVDRRGTVAEDQPVQRNGRSAGARPGRARRIQGPPHAKQRLHHGVEGGAEARGVVRHDGGLHVIGRRLGAMINQPAARRPVSAC